MASRIAQHELLEVWRLLWGWPGAHSKITKEDGVYRGIKLKKLNSYIDDPSKALFVTYL